MSAKDWLISGCDMFYSKTDATEYKNQITYRVSYKYTLFV